MKVQKKIYFIFILVITIFPIYSIERVNVNLFFTTEQINRVKSGEIITRMYMLNNAVGENTDLKIDVPRTSYADEDFSKYEMITDEKAFFPYKINDNNRKLDFYNILASYSKLKGMKYFSRLIMQPQELILNSYRIESPNNKKPLADIIYNKIEQKIESYFFQTDNKLGPLVYKSELYNQDDNFILINTCIDPISKFGINISNKNEYKVITYFIYDKSLQGFYYYSVNVMRIRLKFVLTKNKILTLYPTTFSNRLRGATVYFAKLLDLDWNDKLNPWNEDMLCKGKYRNY